MLSEQKLAANKRNKYHMPEHTQVPRPPYFERAECEIEYWKQFTTAECPQQLGGAGEVCQNGDLRATGSKVTVSIKLPQKRSSQPMQGK